MDPIRRPQFAGRFIIDTTEKRLRHQIDQLQRENSRFDELYGAFYIGSILLTRESPNCKHYHELDVTDTACRLQAFAVSMTERLDDTEQILIELAYSRRNFIIIHIDNYKDLYLRRTMDPRPRTLAEVLSMRLRSFDIDMSIVEIYDPVDVNLQTPIGDVELDEICLRLPQINADEFKVHVLEAKAFYSYAMCTECSDGLFNGFWCRRCNGRYHFRCAVRHEEYMSYTKCRRKDDDPNVHLLDWHSETIKPSVRGRLRETCAEMRLLRKTTPIEMLLLSDVAEEFLNPERGSSAHSFGMSFRSHWYGPSVQHDIPPRLLLPTKKFALYNFDTNNLVAVDESWSKALSLHEHVHRFNGEFIADEDIRYSIALQLARALNYLHAKNRIVQQLSSHCVYLMDDMSVKICTHVLPQSVTKFGVECLDRQLKLLQEKTAQWHAREVKGTNFHHYTKKSDVYAFGVILYEIFCMNLTINADATPLSHKPMLDYKPINEICLLGYVPFIVCKMIKSCLSRRPSRRPFMHEILEKLELLQYKRLQKRIEQQQPNDDGGTNIIGHRRRKMSFSSYTFTKSIVDN